MDSTKVTTLLELLDDEMDGLEESLAPLIKTALSETSSKLPLLDKAKLYVLVTYAIESMLFSYLRLNGVKAREHPVFVELTRVKQYFDKIKVAETPAKERQMVPDKQAVARFIKAGLAGNEKHDLERAEREAKERAKAHIRFNEVSKNASKGEAVKKPAEESDSSDSDSSSESSEAEEEPAPKTVAASNPSKKKSKKKDKSRSSSSSRSSEKESESKPSPKPDKKARKAKREKKKAKLQKKEKKNKS
ncbi:related to exosome-associated family protein [Phialocephala subalpina]|jgi:exosome complex protein LRP1|uniref:Exosome complex protein n=1 Tax=Phialocephala subalpina TaxID=576137 RepID=A0A1L7X088_9HELO|nr:related to exosome-associated family protein [Phialocephala subalpina]